MMTKEEQLEITLYGYLREYALDYPQKPFLFDEGKAFTVAESFCMVENICGELSRLGVKRGDFVALRCERNIQTALTFFALQTLGAVTALCDSREIPQKYIKDCGVALPIQYYIDGCNLISRDCQTASFDMNIGGGKFEVCEDDQIPAVIIFTSGSTGKSKAVVLSQRNIITNSLDTKERGWYIREDINISMLPIHHVFGLSLICTAVVLKHAVFFPENISYNHILACIEKYKITRMNGVPTLYLSLATQNQELKYDISSLRTGLIGGGPHTESQFQEIERILGVRLLPVYGMSECIGISLADYREDGSLRRNGVGHVYDLNKIYIDKSGGFEHGEICVKSPFLMLGYYDNGKINLSLDENGWFHTGDLGYLDEKGILYITGRIKDIIIRGGNNLSTQKIENAILSLPYIYAAAVVGIADKKYGEVPAAMLVFKQGKNRLKEDVGKDLSALLCKNELPTMWKVVDSIPLTSSGKIDKLKVKEGMEKHYKDLNED